MSAGNPSPSWLNDSAPAAGSSQSNAQPSTQAPYADANTE